MLNSLKAVISDIKIPSGQTQTNLITKNALTYQAIGPYIIDNALRSLTSQHLEGCTMRLPLKYA